MKKFDLEAALKGEPVVTKEGAPARIICTDAKGDLPIIALVSNKGVEYPEKYTLDGKFYTKGESVYDLYMDDVKKKSYTNIWEGKNGKRYAEGVFSTKDEAEKQKIITSINNTGNIYISTIEIEWEEENENR